MRVLVASLAALLLASPALAADPVQGRWMTEEKDAVITIAPCGAKLCGRISKFLVAPPQGLDQRDVNNKDASKRSRKLLGMPVLTGFAEDGDEWRGTIYDPKSGKTYRSILQRKGSNQLTVKGCLGPFCQTQTWRKAG
ncbi:DUF2147 domain-containing protein [Qipengyuania sp. XHP0211]|uniref:DUF2147 domain-containing protein n=1 Tax=Qipengyuania sp. XHP0211 TaxID=3038079 RepID=UPI00241CD218|nr:DUF2147 domain-containing protein [Qipengyuania sp. XHP0211]MDG5751845.1 DUF2147 domain-containing protein [Qipengyuania sp. XHP0211]